MKTRFRPFPPVSAKYGAPMGRRDTLRLDPDFHTPEILSAAGPAGEYDRGGAYWGSPAPGEGPVWAVWIRGASHEGVCYVRARSREAAKRAALA